MVAWATALGAGLVHLISRGMPAESVADVDLATGALVALAYLAIFASAIGYVVYFRLLDRLGAIEINLVSYAAPVATAVVGFLFLGEVIDTRTVVGFGVILAGFLLVKRRAVAAALE